MKQAHGWYLPDHEQHLVEHLAHPKNIRNVEGGRVVYQAVKQRAFIEHCRNFRVALDIGGHVGLWSHYLANHFESVHAFEPVSGHRECFVLNVMAPNVILHPVALGSAAGHVSMVTEIGSSGNSHVDGSGEIEMRTLDSFEFDDVDAIKIDTEGYELFILQGAVETLRRCRPTLIVEQKLHVIGNFGFKTAEAIDFLKSIGYVVAKEISGDYICVAQ